MSYTYATVTTMICNRLILIWWRYRVWCV